MNLERESLADAPGNEPVPNFGIADEFPLLWAMAGEFDFAERLGGCTSALHAEVDAAMRELWMARAARRSKAEEIVNG